MANQAFEVPCVGVPETFLITIAGTQYRFTVRWNTVSQCWVLDIADSSSVPIVSGLAMVTGCNLLEQVDYLDLGFQLLVQSDGPVDAVPTFENLGQTGHLYAVVAV